VPAQEVADQAYNLVAGCVPEAVAIRWVIGARRLAASRTDRRCSFSISPTVKARTVPASARCEMAQNIEHIATHPPSGLRRADGRLSFCGCSIWKGLTTWSREPSVELRRNAVDPAEVFGVGALICWRARIFVFPITDRPEAQSREWVPNWCVGNQSRSGGTCGLGCGFLP
jgi:hypothetical protein